MRIFIFTSPQVSGVLQLQCLHWMTQTEKNILWNITNIRLICLFWIPLKKKIENHLVQTFLTTGHFWAGVAYIRTELVAFPYLWFWHFEFVIYSHLPFTHINFGAFTFIWFSRRLETLSQGELKLHSMEQEACQGYLECSSVLTINLDYKTFARFGIWISNSARVWQSLQCKQQPNTHLENWTNGTRITTRE